MKEMFDSTPLATSVKQPKHHEFHALQSIVGKASNHGSIVDKQRLAIEKQDLTNLVGEVDFKAKILI